MTRPARQLTRTEIISSSLVVILALAVSLEPVVVVGSGIRSGQPAVGPAWLMLVSAFVPFLVLGLALLFWKPAAQGLFGRTLGAVGIGILGVVGFVMVVQVLEGLVGQVAPGLVPSPYETSVRQAYGLEWMISLGYLAVFGWLVRLLSRRDDVRPTSPPVLTTSR